MYRKYTSLAPAQLARLAYGHLDKALEGIQPTHPLEQPRTPVVKGEKQAKALGGPAK